MDISLWDSANRSPYALCTYCLCKYEQVPKLLYVQNKPKKYLLMGFS